MENQVAQSPASTLGELKASGYQTLGVREEMRRNLMNKLAGDDEIFPGVVGYEDTVIPQIENAVLSGQDIILLGERGQAKSRMIRSLISLLDETIPVIDGCDVPENPLAPITAQGRNIVAEPVSYTHLTLPTICSV